MSKKVLIAIIIVAVVVIGGLGFIFLNKGTDKNSTSASSTSSSSSSSNSSSKSSRVETEEIFYGVKNFTEVNLGNREYKNHEPYVTSVGTVKVPADAKAERGQGYDKESTEQEVLEHYTPIVDINSKWSMKDFEIAYSTQDDILYQFYVDCVDDYGLTSLERISNEKNLELVKTDDYYYILDKQGADFEEKDDVLQMYIEIDPEGNSNLSIDVLVSDGAGHCYNINNPEKLAKSVYKLFTLNK